MDRGVEFVVVLQDEDSDTAVRRKQQEAVVTQLMLHLAATECIHNTIRAYATSTTACACRLCN